MFVDVDCESVRRSAEPLDVRFAENPIGLAVRCEVVYVELAVMRLPGLVDAMAASVYDFTPWTPLANATGAPSMSVPLCDKAMTFRFAAQLEAARPWITRRPPVYAFD